MKYTGNRYVAKILSVDEGWSKDNEYESLTVVCWGGNSFTSRKYVPKGIEINNNEYWACTGNYNVQVEQYRQDTINAILNVNSKLDNFSNTQNGIFQVMLDNFKAQVNAYANGKYNDVDSSVNQVQSNLDTTENNITASMGNFQTIIQSMINDYTTTVNNQLSSIQNVITSIDLIYDAGTSTDANNPNITIIEGGTI